MGEVVLKLKGVCKEFPGVKALDGVDLEVREGEVMAKTEQAKVHL